MSEARNHRKLLRSDRSESREHDLSTVRVSGEHERNAECGCLVQSPRIVREQNRWCTRPAQHVGDIGGSPGPEPDAGKVQCLVSNREAGTDVPEYLDPPGRQRRGHVVVVIVIAEDRENSVGCGQ